MYNKNTSKVFGTWSLGKLRGSDSEHGVRMVDVGWGQRLCQTSIWLTVDNYGDLVQGSQSDIFM